jgi:hypothetical protein
MVTFFIYFKFVDSKLLKKIFLSKVYCCLKRRNSYKSSNDLNSSHKFNEILIIPVSKPSLNESKPQVNINVETKNNKPIKQTIIER